MLMPLKSPYIGVDFLMMVVSTALILGLVLVSGNVKIVKEEEGRWEGKRECEWKN